MKDTMILAEHALSKHEPISKAVSSDTTLLKQPKKTTKKRTKQQQQQQQNKYSTNTVTAVAADSQPD